MATSSSRNFVDTEDEIIEAALDLVGGLNQGSAAIAAAKTQARAWLNRVVQSLSARGIMQLWTRERRSALLVAEVSQSVVTSGTATYNLGQDVLHVLPDTVFVRRSSLDTPLIAMSHEDYAAEGNKSASGKPTRFLIEANQYYTDSVNSRVIQGRLQIVLHPVPDNSTDAIHYTCVRKLMDFDAATNDPDAPPVWMRALVFGLAADLAIKYGLDMDERTDIRNQFEIELNNLRSHDVPRGGVRFSPRLA